jgi:hypothetical protein
MTVDIWIRDYNPPRCFQKKISGRSKHNGSSRKLAISKVFNIHRSINHNVQIKQEMAETPYF